MSIVICLYKYIKGVGYMRKRRALAIALTVVLGAGSLAGCGSEASKKYLSLSDEVLGYNGMNASGTVTLTANLDEFEKITKEMYMADEDTSDIDGAVKDTLSNGVTIDYNLTTAMPKNLDTDMRLRVKYGDGEYPLHVLMSKEGTYLSTESVASIYKIGIGLAGEESKIDSKAVDNAVVLLNNSGKDWVLVSEVDSAAYEEVMSKAYDFNYVQLASIFGNVSAADIISLDGDSVKIDCNGTKFVRLVRDITQDLITNYDTKGSELFKLFTGANEIQTVMSEKESFISAAQTVVDTMDGLLSGQIIPDEKASKLITNLLEYSKYTAEMKKLDDRIESTGELKIATNSNNCLLSMTEKQSVSEIKGVFEFAPVTQYADSEELLNKILLCNRDFYPVKECKITWQSGGFDAGIPCNDDIALNCLYQEVAEIHLLDSAGEEISSDVCNYKIVDDRIYLPLRIIFERCGYDVSWEDNKAFVTDKSGNKVDMSGMIVNDRTLIKIRDFEKLGVKVDYDDSGFRKVATLTF